MQPHILPQNGLYSDHGLYYELITPIINNPMMNNTRSNYNFYLCREEENSIATYTTTSWLISSIYMRQ
jgi:hypothetical protein